MTEENSGVSPTERILNLAAYLKKCKAKNVDATLDSITLDVEGYDHEKGRTGSGDLASEGPEWESLRRLVRRDLEDLDKGFGIKATFNESDRCYQLAPPFFKSNERTALISAAAAVNIEGIEGGAGQIGTGVNDAEAEIVIQVHPLVAILRDAIYDRQAIEFMFEETNRFIQPWALGKWRKWWYLAGWDPDKEAIRRYRLDRMENVKGVGSTDTFLVADWFDAEKAFNLDPNAWGRDPLLEARVDVDRDFVAAFVEEFGAEIVGDVSTDGDTIEAAFKVRNYDSTRVRLLAFRGHARVISPPQLRDLIRDHLAAIAGIK